MYKATVENWGDSRFLATTRHSSFAMDTQGKGANPVDTLLAALCGCVGHYVRDFLGDKAVALPGFGVTAEATATEDQSKLASISVRIDLGSVRLGDAREAELLAIVGKCKVLGTLKVGCPIDISVQKRASAAA
jgi:uncharacterized OsmC-like protein